MAPRRRKNKFKMSCEDISETIETIDPNNFQRHWGNCPTDILVIIFKKLDILSLTNCMFVNKFWKDVVDYNCQHFRLWKQVVEVNIPEKGRVYREKSKLPWKNLVINFFLWRKVKEATISLHRCYNIEKAKNVQVFQGNLIVTCKEDVKFFNLHNGQNVKTLKSASITYEESQFFAANFYLTPVQNKLLQSLTIVIKHRHANCRCVHNEEINLNAISTFKLHSNSCYVLDLNNTLWNYTTDNGILFIKTGPKCYGTRNSVLAIHVNEDEVFIVMRGGDVFCVDGLQFKRMFNILLPSHNYKAKPYLFYKCSAAFRVPIYEDFEIYEIHEMCTVVLACPGLSALTEHADVVFLGYEDGKIAIHSLRKLLYCMKGAEKVFYLQDIVGKDEEDYKVNSIDVYEDYNRHHLIVTTNYNIYQLYITLA